LSDYSNCFKTIKLSFFIRDNSEQFDITENLLTTVKKYEIIYDKDAKDYEIGLRGL